MRSLFFPSNARSVQRAIVNYLFRLEQLTRQFTFSQIPGPNRKSSRSRQTPKGVRTKRSDIVLWLKGGRSLHIDIKSNQDWITSCDQEHYARLKEFEHKNCVIRAASPKEGVEQMMAILKENGINPL